MEGEEEGGGREGRREGWRERRKGEKELRKGGEWGDKWEGGKVGETRHTCIRIFPLDTQMHNSHPLSLPQEQYP